MQAINVQSTAEYHREGQGNNDTFSQGREKDLQVKSNGRDVWGERKARRLAAHAVSYKLALSGLGEMKLHILFLDCIRYFSEFNIAIRLKHKELQN